MIFQKIENFLLTILRTLNILKHGKAHMPTVISWAVVIITCVISFNITSDNLVAVGTSVSALITAFSVSYALTRNKDE